MYISRVTIKGFMPFEQEQTLSFNKGQIIGIKGAYNGDFSQSNRAGKSAFIDAIVWCLYGKSRSKREVELVHDGSDEARVTTEISDETGIVETITRERTSSNKGFLELSRNQGEKKAVTQKEIDKILGMNYEEFLFTAFFKQNDIDQFMKADAQKKKQILMTWIQTNNWSVYEEQANLLKKDLNQKRQELMAKIDGLPDEDRDETEIRDEINRITKEKSGLDGEYESLSSQIVQLQMQLEELNKCDDIKRQIGDTERRIQQLKNQRPDSSKYQDALDKLEKNLNSYPLITQGKYDEAVSKKDKASSEIGAAKIEAREARERLKKMKTEMTGICPLLNESCSRIEFDPEMQKDLERQIEGYEKKASNFESLKGKCEKIMRLFEAQRDWKSKKENMEEKIRYANEIERQIGDLMSKKSELQNSLPEDVDSKKNQLAEQISQTKARQNELKNQYAHYDRQLGELSEILNQAIEKRERQQGLEKDLEQIEQQLADAQYVEYMFGKNGIPSMELENSFQDIEDDSNLILKSLNAPFHIEFQAVRELAKWEPNCLACGTPFEKGEKSHVCKNCETPREKQKKDELTLKVYENGYERPFYLDSGGGQIEQCTAIRLALTQLHRRRRGQSWGTIFLDELFGQLDQTNRKLMSELISTLLRQLGFEQTFLISHDPSIQTAIADSLVVNRDQEKNKSELYLE